MDQSVTQLSGGSKQKVVFGKWIGCGSDILILDCPTRGIDIGVKQTMYQLMYRMKKEGKTIIMISEEMTELMGMADRLIIMKDGRITKEFPRSPDLSDAEIIKYISTKTTAPIISATKKTKNPDTYFRRYESQIILYGGARRMLEQAGINLKGLNVDKLKAEYQELMKQENLNQYLGQTQPDPAQGQQEKNKNQSL